MNNLQQIISLAESMGCQVKIGEPLSNRSTFKVGGECRAFVEISSEQALIKLKELADKLQVYSLVLGNGSNMLFDDRGFDGVIFHIGSGMSEIKLTDEATVTVQAGVSLNRLCLFALEHSLSGLEFAYGIPGTVGGAVFMNAGAYGGEIKDVILSAQAVSEGELKTFEKDEMKLSYRSSCFQSNGAIVTSAVIRLKKGDREQIKARMNELMGKRKEKQPLDYPNAGSTFKRPVGQFAGKLIEDCGLRGKAVGGAEVSVKHCGFIVNKGGATSEDIKNLISLVQNEVKEKTGFFLECEVRIIPCTKGKNT